MHQHVFRVGPLRTQPEGADVLLGAVLDDITCQNLEVCCNVDRFSKMFMDLRRLLSSKQGAMPSRGSKRLPTDQTTRPGASKSRNRSDTCRVAGGNFPTRRMVSRKCDASRASLGRSKRQLPSISLCDGHLTLDRSLNISLKSLDT